MKRTPIKRVSDKRRSELAEYKKRRAVFMKENPVDMIWLVENGWTALPIEPGLGRFYRKGKITCSQTVMIIDLHAPRSTECHHVNKRRGIMINQTEYWMALCRENHERVELNKQWARANGYLLNF